MPDTLLPTGKLPPELLDELLARHSRPDPRVVLGPRTGEDAAIIDMGDRYLVAKTDPITFATDEIGWYAVNVNANDVACCGAAPKWFLATLLLPEQRTDSALVERVFGQIAQACAALDVTLCGGHTEITYGLDRPIVVGQMLGEVSPDAFLTTSGALPGDALILTKGIALEGTAIIASEKRAELAGTMDGEELDRCADLLHDPGISVVPDADCAIAAGGVHALHDPTEGGLATSLWELARAAGVGVRIDEDALPVLESLPGALPALRSRSARVDRLRRAPDRGGLRCRGRDRRRACRSRRLRLPDRRGGDGLRRMHPAQRLGPRPAAAAIRPGRDCPPLRRRLTARRSRDTPSGPR